MAWLKLFRPLGVETVDMVSVVQHHPALQLAWPLDCRLFFGPDPKPHTLAVVST